MKLGKYEIKRIKHRGMLQYLKNKYGSKNITGVEIGVLKGLNAKNYLTELNINKLFLIDPYEPYYEKKMNKSFLINCEKLAKNNLKHFKNKIEFVKLYSGEATEWIPNNLDFVYIDGNHKYSSIMNDIENYLPLIKKGGVIGGHDFHIDNTYKKNDFGVVEAVINKFGLENIYAHDEDWYYVKD